MVGGEVKDEYVSIKLQTFYCYGVTKVSSPEKHRAVPNKQRINHIFLSVGGFWTSGDFKFF